MRCWIRLIVGCVWGFAATVSPVVAGSTEDCGQLNVHDLRIRACSDLIQRNPRDSWAYGNRGAAHNRKGDYDRAIVDLNEAIRLHSKFTFAYHERSNAYRLKGDYDRAIADLGTVISLNPYSEAYSARGALYGLKKQYDLAIADNSQAIKLNPRNATAYADRGSDYADKGHFTQALSDLGEAIQIDPSKISVFLQRGEVYQLKGEKDKAIEDYRKALSIPAKVKWEENFHATARRKLAALEQSTPSTTVPAPISLPLPPSLTRGRRVALAIGNAAYKHVQPLPNPRKDAADVATALKAAGFADVEVLYDLDLREMQRALAAFERKATGADWAVVYYGGHGIQVDGRNFLVPVDAKLEVATDVEDETLALERVLARMAQAGKLQLVILDACRDNPFKRAWSGSTRTVAERGLARFEPTLPNVFVAYAARDGQAALDGPPGANSPYAKALVRYLAEPGLELQMFFRRVRDQVLKDTGRRQQPFEYGSLSSESLFFKPAR